MQKNLKIAKTYAMALLNLIDKPVQQKKIAEELKVIVENCSSSDELMGLFSHPLLKNEQKQLVVGKLLKKMKVSQVVVDFLTTVARRGRLDCLCDIVDCYIALYQQQQGCVNNGCDTPTHMVMLYPYSDYPSPEGDGSLV